MIKLGELVMILDLHRQGLTVSAIARQLGIDRKTVRRYIERGLGPPTYGPRPRRPKRTDPFLPYLRERLAAYPGLTAVRLWRELRERGYVGGYTAVKRTVREIRPEPVKPFETFETPPGTQAQVDFPHFEVVFTDEPGVTRIVWLFSMVLGFSRLIWARFVVHQDLQAMLRCHIAALEAIDGVPHEILYDRMKTAVIGEDADGLVVYNRSLLDLARHYGFQPKACRPYRPKPKARWSARSGISAKTSSSAAYSAISMISTFSSGAGSTPSPMPGSTRPRSASSTKAFAEEKPHLKPLPLAPYRAVLKLERRVSHEGMVSVAGNLYSVPDTTRRRIVDVHVCADEIRILENGAIVAIHTPLEGASRRVLTQRTGGFWPLRADARAMARPLSSAVPATRSPAARSTSTKPSPGVSPAREVRHDSRNRALFDHAHQANHGRPQDAARPLGRGLLKVYPARARPEDQATRYRQLTTGTPA